MADQARVEAAARIVRQIDASVRRDEPVVAGTPEWREEAELREAVRRIADPLAGLVAHIKVRPVQAHASAEPVLLQRGHPAVAGERRGAVHLPRGICPECQKDQQ